MSLTIIGGRRVAVDAPPSAPPLLRSLSLVSPVGTVDLMKAPWSLLPGYEGLDDVDAEPETITVPGLDGQVLRDTGSARGKYHRERVPILPARVGAGPGVRTPGDVDAAVQRLRDVLNDQLWDAEDGDLRLVATRHDETVRWAACTWTPLKGDLGSANLWQPSRRVTVRLLATDPRALSEATPITWALPRTARPMLPFLPLVVGSSTVLGFPNPVRVEGDRTAWPACRVRGPAIRVQALRGDGEQWTVIPPVPTDVGQEFVVRTDPRTGVADDYDRVQGPGGVPWNRYWQPGSVPWGLRPGRTEQVTILIEGATADTSATFEWDHAWGSLA